MFRNGLENLEVEPAPGTWQSIQSRIPSGATSAVTSGSTGLSGMSKIFIAAGLVTVTTGSFLLFNYFSKEDPSLPQTKTNSEMVVSDSEILSEATVADENNPAVLSENIQSPESSGKKTVTSPVKNKSNVSSASGFMTNQTVKDQLWRSWYNSSKSTNDLHTEVVANNSKTNTVINENPETVTETTKDVSAKIIADKLTGTSPLKVNFHNITEANYYEWNFGDGSVSYDEKPEYVFERAGTYEVSLIVKDKKGTSFTHKIQVEVKDPSSIKYVNQNIFTPNNDGVNDVFRFESVNIDKFQIHIYNSSSQVVFKSEDPDFQWDGRDASGNLCPEGKYTFIFVGTGKDGHKYKTKGELMLSLSLR
jgi:gliding motility-associated-like protein